MEQTCRAKGGETKRGQRLRELSFQFELGVGIEPRWMGHTYIRNSEEMSVEAVHGQERSNREDEGDDLVDVEGSEREEGEEGEAREAASVASSARHVYGWRKKRRRGTIGSLLNASRNNHLLERGRLSFASSNEREVHASKQESREHDHESDRSASPNHCSQLKKRRRKEGWEEMKRT